MITHARVEVWWNLKELFNIVHVQIDLLHWLACQRKTCDVVCCSPSFRSLHMCPSIKTYLDWILRVIRRWWMMNDECDLVLVWSIDWRKIGLDQNASTQTKKDEYLSARRYRHLSVFSWRIENQKQWKRVASDVTVRYKHVFGRANIRCALEDKIQKSNLSGCC